MATHSAPDASEPPQPAEGGDPPPTLPPESELEARSAAMHDDPRFHELRRRLLRFVVPASIAFFGWYVLYVLMSAYARGVMETEVVGSANIALLFGLLQFVTTFGIAILYSRYANRRYDPLADELRDELEGQPAVPGARKGDDE
ncbi:Uncharacterized membrane protein, DUF485 family [Streptomyces zhaozhouensis]|uniref:Uncharacterized membrane protein, DUF485 family n=1 Tax=Streptomyces zhaozhouensis TaxID=1300267 RepID=A0A286DT99_9ACTN|nr:DUF485 domain-containing protein [Streptomyces zhaozhouensis]SOD61880.1 Uncharacterized membrane protein, DUF485 family [Streptomyces zhaozhouensis]